MGELGPSRAGSVGPLQEAAAKIRRIAPIEVAFTGWHDRRSKTFTLENMIGTRTKALDTIVGAVGTGVGGKCIAMAGPVTVLDYAAARGITHQFDRAVSIEGLRSVLAVPVRVSGGVRAVVYGASRSPMTFGDGLLRAAMAAVADAERSLEARLRAEEREAEATASVHDLVGKVQEVYAELRAIAAGVDDQDLRTKLLLTSERLCRPVGQAAPADLKLSPRETDVLIQVAVGCTNAEVAQRLSLRVETVKSYLKSAMCKLDSHNRVDAVRVARKLGLLP